MSRTVLKRLFSERLRDNALRTADRLAQLSRPENLKLEHFGLYKALDLDPSCSIADVKGTYKELMKLIHPDLPSGKRRPVSPESFELVQTAYRTLSDELRRQQYHQSQQAGRQMLFFLIFLVMMTGASCFIIPALRKRQSSRRDMDDIWH